MRNAAFPVIKTSDELDRAACSIPGPTPGYLATPEWITAKENLVLVGPAGTGKSHVLVAAGIAAVQAGHKVRYYAAADLVDASTAPSPTTPSARSSTPCSATT